jgi:hypothetical protein
LYDLSGKLEPNATDIPKYIPACKSNVPASGRPFGSRLHLAKLVANVTGISLSETEFIANPGGESIIKIDVLTEFADPEGNVLTFNYKVSVRPEK